MYYLNGNVLGYAQITSDFTTTTASSDVDVTSLTTTVTVPAGGRRIKITVYTALLTTSAIAGSSIDARIKEGVTQLSTASYRISTANYYIPLCMVYVVAATAGSHTYKVAVNQSAAGTASFGASSSNPAFILVELL